MDLPSILSGPIVRRTEASHVHLWIATSEDYSMDAALYDVDNAYRMIDSETETETIELGKKLFIHLVKIMPVQEELPTNRLIGYNLFFRKESTTIDLNQLGLLSKQNPHAIIYGDFKYPTFYMNTRNANNVLYGSCRKPQSYGDDALVGADLIIEESQDDICNRPSSLFLMGNQIYADDIPVPLRTFIMELGKELIGKDEKLERLDTRLKMNSKLSFLNELSGRQYMIKQLAQFTPNHGANHLITLGEYAAMYLLSFGPQLWDLAESYGVFDTFNTDMQDDYFVAIPDQPNKKALEKELNQNRMEYIEQATNIYQFQQDLYRIRRLLANTPTYMIFDDHDITGDWNLTSEWKTAVRNAPLGKHIVANGLAAYWAFQGWGNNPNAFDTLFKATMQNYMQAFSIESDSYQDWVDMLWNFNDWQFVAPTYPKAIFLDTRTMRSNAINVSATKEEEVQRSQLKNTEGWKKASALLKNSGWKHQSPLIVVSPRPLYGNDLIEATLYNFFNPLRFLGIKRQRMLDLKARKYNRDEFHTFYRWLAECNPSHCFILSGDSHYAAALKSTVEYNEGKNLKLYQFTSSRLTDICSVTSDSFLTKAVHFIKNRMQKRIFRYCDNQNNLVIEDKGAPCPPTYRWRETIRYLSTENGKMIDTENNVGMLILDSQSVQNVLVKYYGLHKQMIPYEKLNLID
ncbi:hypothetical protein [Aquibacillus albus]|uniref:PhoD-like phosphatase metallophosphatase domain-containing protein n=1 Tax=Aquibacillus albus TaxID=1168171 RepID=A0ABS2N3A9_9BACI|nr:hypothetical protein [Aquibacillus albus]MBM7572601.1 hypothetical protein [Aquibacillus albus]